MKALLLTNYNFHVGLKVVFRVRLFEFDRNVYFFLRAILVGSRWCKAYDLAGATSHTTY